MANVDLVTANQAPLLLRDLYAGGDPGPIVGALAHVPELAEPALPFIGAALGPSSVSFRLKEIAILRTSARMACRYCTEAHTVVAAEAGLSVEEIKVLRCELDSADTFDADDEQALIDWCDVLAGPPGPIDPAVIARLRDHFDDHAVVELTTTIGTTLMLNRFATGLALPTSPETYQRLIELGLPEFAAAETPVTIGKVAS